MFKPKYHLTNKGFLQNSMLSFFKEEYHIFFLTPDNAKDKEGNYLGWGHFRSKDLTDWVQDSMVIKPDKEYDKYGCWNGSVVVKNDIPYLFYTGINPESLKVLMDSIPLQSWAAPSDPVHSLARLENVESFFQF